MSTPSSSTRPPTTGPATQQTNWQRTLWASWIAQFLSLIAFSAVMPFMPFFIRELGVQDEGQVARWAGLMVTASGLTLTLFAPVWGTLSDRFGRKIMVERAMFGGAVVLLAMGMVRNVYQLLAMRIVQGMLTGTISATIVLVSSVTPRDHLAYSLGLLQMAVLAGNCIGPWIGGVVADHWGYRLPFVLAGGCLFLGGMAVLVGVREHFTPRPAHEPRTTGLRRTFGTKGLLALLGVFFGMSFSMSFVGPIYPLFVERIAVGYRPASITGMLLGVSGIAAGFSALAMGRLSDRYGHKRLLVGSVLARGLVALPQSLAQSVGQLFGFSIAGGLVAGGTAPVMNAIIGTAVPPEIYGRAYGFTQAASSMGFALGPLVGASLSSVVGLRWPFAIMGMLLIGCAGLVQLFIKTDQPSSPTPAGRP